MEVLIGGVVYAPKNEIPELTDERIKRCLASLTAIQYFYDFPHKHRAWAYDAIAALAPDIAELCSNDTEAAFNLFNPD
jgi:hypothetical protein